MITGNRTGNNRYEIIFALLILQKRPTVQLLRVDVGRANKIYKEKHFDEIREEEGNASSATSNDNYSIKVAHIYSNYIFRKIL